MIREDGSIYHYEDTFVYTPSPEQQDQDEATMEKPGAQAAAVGRMCNEATGVEDSASSNEEEQTEDTQRLVTH